MKAVKIGIVVCCALAAGLIVYMSSGPVEPDAEALDFVTTLKCVACGAVYEVNGTEYHAAMERVNHTPPLYCAKCSEKRAYHVIKCPVCGTYFFREGVEGSNGQCPVCRPDFEPTIVDDAAEPEINDPGTPEGPRRRRHAKSM